MCENVYNLCVHRVFLPQTGRLENRYPVGLFKMTSIVLFQREQSVCHNANKKTHNYPLFRHLKRETDRISSESINSIISH